MKKSACLAFATKIIGDKWTPRLLFALSQGTLRFGELQEQAGGVNSRTLTLRLVYLESLDIVKKTMYAEIPPRTEYALTAKGRELVPILQQMVSWGQKHQKEI